MLSTSVSVGSRAPEVFAGRARVVAFVRQWSFDRDELPAIRSQLRGLGAELTVLADHGAWSFRPDDDVEYCDRLADEIATTAAQFGVRDGRDAIFVIDDTGIIRFEHRPIEPMQTALCSALDAACEAMVARPPSTTFNRREWMTTCLVAGFAFSLLRGCKQSDPPAAQPASLLRQPPNEIQIVLDINGKQHTLEVEPRVSLLDVLRERLGLTGTKKGCDAGQCGACTVRIGGQRVVSCLTLAVMAQGRPITTIEGLARGSDLHPVQMAFIEHDGLQCGFCTPGQIMSAIAMLDEGHATTDDEVREQMSGNLCRCGAYPNIVAAIQAGRKGLRP